VNIFNKIVVWGIPFVPKFMVRRVANRYIAGTHLDDAVRVVRNLNADGLCATLDVLGEHITEKSQAEEAVQEYLRALERIEKEKLDSNISIKLTMLGLKLGLDFCVENVRRLLEKAKELNNFVRIDMEDSSCTTDTLRVYEQLKKEFDNVGFVIQSYMRRSLQDIRDQMQRNGPLNVRVCKGIYIEPREIAYKDGQIVNWNFMYLVEELLKNGHYVGIATHDERLVWTSYKLIDGLALSKDKFEFQMLLGVDEQLRGLIRDQGFKLRVYVPYGQEWYAYSTRRLKENPKIAGYVIRNFLGIG